MRQKISMAEHRALLAAVALVAVTCCPAAAALSADRVVCFITNWSQYRPCYPWQPRQLNATLCTHIFFAFAFLNRDHSILLREWNDASVLLPQTLALKKQNSQLKLSLAIGGWSMNNPDSVYRFRFSQAVATATSRWKFINNTMAWIERFGFDGVDIDWEYPGDTSRGGSAYDKRNLALFLQEFQAENKRRGKSYLLTMSTGAAAPGRIGLDMDVMICTLDFVNIMTYDYHGAWESQVNHLAPWTDPQGGFLDINTTLNHYIRVAKWPKHKINLGLATYGRSWQLAPRLCAPIATAPATVGARASGVGPASKCTGEAGYHGWMEIRDMIATGRMKVAISSVAKAAYLETPGKAWVSFDLPETMWMKVVAAREMGLGGVMTWTADLDDRQYTMLKVMRYKKHPGSYRQYLPRRPSPPPPMPRQPSMSSQACVGVGVSSAAAEQLAGMYCGGGSAGNGACQARSLCCSQWGHCGAGPEYCILERGCLGGPCRSYAGTPLGQALPSNGTSMTDSQSVYNAMSSLKGALGGPAP